VQDGAEPSANSVASMNLLRLYLVTDELCYKTKQLQLLSNFANEIEDASYARPSLLTSLIQEMALPRKVVFLLPTEKLENPLTDENIRLLKRCVDNRHDPQIVFSVQSHDDPETKVQLCRGTVCQIPVKTCNELAKVLDL
jgi:uncharacterized protein YyaL (SSP411 family)